MKTKSKSITAALAAVILAGFGAGAAFSGNSAQQTVTYEVQAFDDLTVSAPSVSLTVNSATAGSAPDVATDSTTTYSITTNGVDRMITGMINSDMPSGVTLSVRLEAPTGARSRGMCVLSTTPVTLVSDITGLSESGRSISYELAATSAAGVIPSASRTVTLTIVDGGG